jgi:hypothetical protein
VADRPLKPGRTAELSFQFAGFPDPVRMEAAVRWCHRDTLSLAPKWRAGLTIRHISPAHESRLAEVDRTYLG